MTDTQRIAAALGSWLPWPVQRRRVHVLSDKELAEAEHFERLGQRRVNTLKALRAERFRREGRMKKMLRLRVETK